MNIHLKEQLLKIADDTEGTSLIDGFSSGDSIGKILEKLYQTIDSNLSDSGYSEEFSDAVCSKLLGILVDNLSAGVEFDAALTSALSSLDFLFVSDSFNDVSVSERFITALASGEKLEAALDTVIDAIVPDSIRSVLSPEARAELIQAIGESLASSIVSEGNTQTGLEFSVSFLDLARKAVTETLHRSRDSMEISSSDSAGTSSINTSKSGHKNDNHEAGPQNANTSNETLLALASGENVTQVLQPFIGNGSSASTDLSSLFNHVFVDSLQNGNTLDTALRTMAETGRTAHNAALNTQSAVDSDTSDELSSDEHAGENSSPSDDGNSTQNETDNARANTQASSEGNNSGDASGSGNEGNGSNGRNVSNNNPANQTDNALNSESAGSQELMLALASGNNVESHISQFAENRGFATSEGFFQDALVSALASSTSIASAVEQATSFVESETTQTAELELRENSDNGDNPDYEDGTDLLAALASGDDVSEALDDLPNPDNQDSGPQGASTNLAQLTLMNELASGESVATAMAQATVVAQELNQAAHNTQTIQVSSLGTHEATESGSESLASNNDGDNDNDQDHVQVQGVQADQAADTQSLIEALASGHNVSVQLSEITQGQDTVAGNAIQQTLVNVLSNGADVNLALTQANNLSLEISQIESELKNNLFSGQNNSSDENTHSNDPQNSDELSRQEANSSELSVSEEQSVESADDHQAASDLMIALSSGENIETVLAEISGTSELENSGEYFQALGQALANGVTGSQSIANAGASQQQSVEAIAAAQLSGSNLDEGSYQTQANSIEQDDLRESFNTQQTSTGDFSEDIVTGTDAEVRENTIIKIASLDPSGSSSTFSNVLANEIHTGNTANDHASSESLIGTGNNVNEYGSAQTEETDNNETNLEPEDTEKEREEERAAETEEFVLENIQPIARAITLSAFEDDASISDYLGVNDENIFDSHQFTLTSTPENGNVNTSVDGAFTYELGDNFQSLAEGQSQEITFQYHVEDNSGWGNSTSEEQSVTITILGRNDSPSITGDSSGSVTEDIASITTGSLIGFDIDNNTILSWSVDNSVGEYGDLAIDNNGQWSYQLRSTAENVQSLTASDFVHDSFQVILSDEFGASAVQVISVDVSGINDTPIISGSNSGSVAEDRVVSLTDTLVGFDIDNNAQLDWRIENPIGTYGELTIDTNGQWTYQLNNNAINVQALSQSDRVTDTFTVELRDQFGEITPQSVSTVSIDIEGTDDVPIISGDLSAYVTEDVVSAGSSLLTVSGEISAVNGDAGEAVFLSQTLIGSYGDLAITENGTWIYSADNNQENIQNIAVNETLLERFTVTNADGVTRSPIEIVIRGVNDAPTINASIQEMHQQNDAPFLLSEQDLLAGANDVDNNTLDGTSLTVSDLTLVSGEPAGIIISNGTSLNVNPSFYTYLAESETENINFSYTINDGQGGSVAQTATISITGSNDAPTVSSELSYNLSEDNESFTISIEELLSNASDIDGEALEVSNLSLLSGDSAGVTVTANGLFIDPDAYGALALGDIEPVIEYGYDIIDGSGGVVTQTATITITPENDAPVIAYAISAETSEDDAGYTVNLLDHAGDIDGDALNVENVLLITGDDSGITLDSNRLLVNPGAYGSLALGDSNAVIEYSYDINDGNGGIVSQTARITITPENDAPVITSEITETFSEDAESYTVNLLDGATDIDGNELNIAGLTLISGDASGFTSENNSLTINPNAYNYLAVDDQDVVVHYIYYIDDGIGGLVSQTATFTITSVNDAPTVFSQLIVAFTEDEPVYSLDLLAGAIDPDGELLTVSGLSLLSGNDDGISFSQNSLTVDPNFYTAMAVGDSDNIIVYNYDIIDGSGGIYSQTASIIISPENDNPSIASAIYSNASEDDSVYSVNLLSNATDIDGDTLNISDLTLLSGDASGVNFSLNALSIAPSVYGGLAVGDPDSIIEYSYTIVDGNGGAVSQTATITISPENDNPIVTSAITFNFSEDDSTTSIDLLNGAIDPDGDALEINAFTVTTGNSAGLSLTSNSLTINPGAYTSLALNDPDLAIEFTYGIVDNNGGIINQTGSITITAENDIPIVSSSITSSTSISSAIYQVDLLAGASDVDAGTTLNVEGFNVLSGNNVGVTLSGNSLIIDPVAYIQLTLTEDEIIQYAYTITDGDGGSVNQTADINISGISDIPRSAFSITSNPNLGDDSLPSYEINGLIDNNNSQDLYRFDLQAGERVILDIDYARHVSGIDTVLTLYDFNGDRIAYWDDSSISSGGGGSEHSYDSYVNYQAVGNQDTYYIGVTSFSNFPTSISEAITNGGSSGSYQLNISIDSSGLIAANEKVSAPFDSTSLIREDIVSRTDAENNLSLSALVDHGNSSISVREFEVPERFVANDFAQEYQENTMFDDFNEWNAVS